MKYYQDRHQHLRIDRFVLKVPHASTRAYQLGEVGDPVVVHLWKRRRRPDCTADAEISGRLFSFSFFYVFSFFLDFVPRTFDSFFLDFEPRTFEFGPPPLIILAAKTCKLLWLQTLQLGGSMGPLERMP